MAALNAHQQQLFDENAIGFGGLSALFVNTSLKRDPHESHTRRLMNVSAEIMARNGVHVEHVHMLSHDIPPGVYLDMTEHGFSRDAWPGIWEKVKAAQILVDGKPVGLDNDFTQRNTTMMTWNLMHAAKMLRDADGYSSHGNDRNAWKAGCRPDCRNPEYRS